MPQRLPSSSLAPQTQITAVSGTAQDPKATLSGYWKLDQTLTGNITGSAGKLAATVDLNGVAFDGGASKTIPLNTTTTNTSNTETYYATFVANNTSSNQLAYVSSNLQFIPNSGKLTVGSLDASGTISGSNISSSANIAANSSLSGSSSGTNTGDQTLSGLGGAPIDYATFTGTTTIPGLILSSPRQTNAIKFAGAPGVDALTIGHLATQQTKGTYQGVLANTSVGLIWPGSADTPTGPAFFEVRNQHTSAGANAQVWINADTAMIQLVGYSSGTDTSYGGGAAGLVGNSTNGMFFQEKIGSTIKFAFGQTISAPPLTITNSVTTATSATSAPVTVAGGLGVSGDIVASGNVTAYSDIQLKDNIETINDALNKVLKVRGVTYTRADLEDTLRRYTGVIAQEIESVLPEAVMTDSDGFKSVAYGNVIGLLIESIKELNSKVESLQKQIGQQ